MSKPSIIDVGASQIMEPGETSVASAEIDRQIATAKRYPRSIERFRSSVRNLATLNEEVAEQCLYAMPRAGKTIEGPSIRFAEIVLAAWGNCRVASEVVGEDEAFVKARGLFWDLETNSAIGFEVRRRITDKYGKRYDVDLIGVTGAAASAIARRNATLNGVPKALWWDLYLEARSVAVGSVETLASRRAKAIAAFKRYGVTEAQIFATLGIAGIAEIDLDKLATLKGFWTAITSEEKDPEEIFTPAETKATAREKPAAPTPPAAPATPKPKASTPAPAPASAEQVLTGLEMSVADMLLDAKSQQDLDALPRMFESELENAGPEVAKRIAQMIADKRKEL